MYVYVSHEIKILHNRLTPRTSIGRRDASYDGIQNLPYLGTFTEIMKVMGSYGFIRFD